MRLTLAHEPRALKVLVVDDQETQRAFVRMLLGDGRFDLEVAQNGRLGLERVRTWRPDVILLDVAMPEMDGITVARLLRADPEMAAIPIVMVTTPSGADVVRQASPGCAIECVLKPARKDELVAKILSAVGR